MSESTGLNISLAAWSLHRAFFAREIDQLGMLEACAEMAISGFELVNTFFPAPQYAYLRHMKRPTRRPVPSASACPESCLY